MRNVVTTSSGLRKMYLDLLENTINHVLTILCDASVRQFLREVQSIGRGPTKYKKNFFM